MTYKTRAHQVRAFEREVKSGQCSLRRALRDAAMVGAHEERYRMLSVIRRCAGADAIQARMLTNLETWIVSQSVLDVLGFENPKRKEAKRG